MSKKHLAKTAIEGGRANSNKWARRESHAEERAYEKEFISKVIIDPDLADKIVIKKRKKVHKYFSYNLTPVYKWIASHIGQPWNDVYSKIRQKFDVRTTDGRHVVYDHLIGSVEITPDLLFKYYRSIEGEENSSYYKWDFYVDDNGILRKKKYVSRRIRRGKCDTVRVSKWLAGRIVAQRDSKMYWCEPTNYNFTAFWYGNRHVATLSYMYLDKHPVYKGEKIVGYTSRWIEPFYYKYKRITSKQGKEFSEKDYYYWNRIPVYYQNVMLQWSPFNQNPPEIKNSGYAY